LEHTDSLEHLEIKAAKVPALDTSLSRLEFVREMILYYLDGQNIEAQLSATYPDLWLRLTTLKTARGRSLRAMNLLETIPAEERLRALATTLAEEIANVFPSFRQHSDALAWGTIAAWLAECALDFRSQTIG
jgi:hypothetical protein